MGVRRGGEIDQQNVVIRKTYSTKNFVFEFFLLFITEHIFTTQPVGKCQVVTVSWRTKIQGILLLLDGSSTA